MRLITGKFGGRRLHTAVDEGLRPAMERTRKALFSMLEADGFSWQDSCVLDLFAGCGSLGLECVSRGAAVAWFVDNGRPAEGCLQKNLAQFGVQDKCRVFKSAVSAFLKRPAPFAFNLIFIDPPYRRRLLAPAMKMLQQNNWLLPASIVVAEIEKDGEIPLLADCQPFINRLFGQTRLCAWKKPA